MGLREQEIIKNARIVLNDSDKHRWTDERLFQLLDDAQQEVCRELPLISRRLQINVVSGQEEYSMPNNYVKMLTASYMGRALNIVSTQEMDTLSPTWEEDLGGSIDALVVNNLGERVIRPYPLLTQDAQAGMIKLRYAALPTHLEYENMDTKHSLTIADMWDVALKHWVVSQAFMDYGDESSLSRAQLAASLFGGVMNKAAKLSKQSSSNRTPTTPYQGRVVNARSNSIRNYNGRTR